MRTLIRQTVTGSEYWDNELKKTVFVPADQEPDFEIMENPKTMIANSENKQSAVSVNTNQEKNNADDKQGYINDDGEADNPDEKPDDKTNLSDNNNQEKDADDVDEKQGYIDDDGELVEYQSMTFKDLKKYADENDIAVSTSIKSKAKIIELIVAAENDE